MKIDYDVLKTVEVRRGIDHELEVKKVHSEM